MVWQDVIGLTSTFMFISIIVYCGGAKNLGRGKIKSKKLI